MGHVKRKPLTRKQIRTLMKRQDGKCACGCGAVLIVGPQFQHVNWIDEHRIPLAAGGTNAFKNREARHTPCAKRKTTHKRGPHTTLDSDCHTIKKIRHIRTGKMLVTKDLAAHRPPKPKKHKWVSRPLRSRGFDKVKRPMRRKPT